MTLRQKTILAIIVTFVCLFVALDRLAWRLLHADLERLEQREVQKNTARVEQAWTQRQRRLEATTLAWSQWDDAYRFAKDGNEPFRRTNLTGDALLPAGANVLVIVRRDGKVLAQLGFDLKTKRVMPLPAGFLKHFQRGGAFYPARIAQKAQRGLLIVDGKPLIAAAEPILPSNGKGASRGVWVFARFFDDDEVANLSQIVALPLSLKRWDSALPPDFAAAKAHLQHAHTPVVQVADENTVAGYLRLDDLYGRPALLAHAHFPREVYQQGRANLMQLRRSLAIMGVVFCLVILLLMERLVLRRLGDLSAGLTAIRANANDRLQVVGGDELSSLAGAFNETLGALQKTQKTLSERQRQFDRIVANVPGVVFRLVRNADGVVALTFVSEGSRRLFGIDPDVLQRELHLMVPLVFPADRAAFTEAWQAAELSQGRWVWEGRILHTDGTCRWVSGVAHPDLHNENCIVWDGLLTDISKRKDAEAALQLAHDELELRVATRTAELQQSNAKLHSEITERQIAESALRAVMGELEQARFEAESANLAKSDFLSRVSHELRTPMNAILGFAQLLEWDDLPEEQMESVQQILRAGRHLLKLINEVLEISSIETGTITFSAENLNASSLCEEAVALVRPLAEKDGIALHVAAPAPDLLLRADALRLRQVLLNLLSNAVKYNRPGGSVTIGAEPKGDTRARLWVRDTGIGLSQEQQARLFMPFDRLGAERTDVEGTGIGLVLARRLVEAMDGNIGVQSAVGQGSTFWVDLPRPSNEEAPLLEAPKAVTSNSDFVSMRPDY